jgi:putative transposase
MVTPLRHLIHHTLKHLVLWLEREARNATRPYTGLLLGALADRLRSSAELAAENRLLRQQLILACRQIKKPRLTPRDRVTLVLLARQTKTWISTMLLVRPETVLRWHREGFKLFWRRKSKTKRREPRVSSEIIALIQKMARNNRLWGAERIRGELLKLGIQHAKSTIQRYMNRVRRPPSSGQRWTTFLRNHGRHIWACDFLQTYDLFFRPIFAFFILEIGSRRVVDVAVTRSPTRAWTAQQLRNATAWGEGPKFLIRDNDDKFGEEFDRVAEGSCTRVIAMPHRAPNANAYCERFLGSVRRECLDHLFVVSERQLLSVLEEYCGYHNQARPHQGIGQRVPELGAQVLSGSTGRVLEMVVLGGLHHDYRLAA